jgi:hypothetical protein
VPFMDDDENDDMMVNLKFNIFYILYRKFWIMFSITVILKYLLTAQL